MIVLGGLVCQRSSEDDVYPEQRRQGVLAFPFVPETAIESFSHNGFLDSEGKSPISFSLLLDKKTKNKNGEQNKEIFFSADVYYRTSGLAAAPALVGKPTEMKNGRTRRVLCLKSDFPKLSQHLMPCDHRT